MSLKITHILQEMIGYFKNDVRRINHALKVYSLAKSIGEAEELSQEAQWTLEAAAILHDIGIKEAERKYQSTAGRYQEQEGPIVAKTLLEPMKLPEQQLERILYLIGHHHSYQSIEGMDFQILVEADFLVNIYEDEMNDLQIESILRKYFKTQLGTTLLNQFYRT